MEIRGRVWKLGDNIDTDQILPGRYLSINDPAELGKHCLEGLDRSLPSKIGPGDVLVAGANFGCGSSREHAPVAIKACGIGAVVAVSFARIFFRNAINIGLPVFECGEAYCGANCGDLMLILPEQGLIKNVTTGEQLEFGPYPPLVADIIRSGGLLPYVRMRLNDNIRGREPERG